VAWPPFQTSLSLATSSKGHQQFKFQLKLPNQIFCFFLLLFNCLPYLVNKDEYNYYSALTTKALGTCVLWTCSSPTSWTANWLIASEWVSRVYLSSTSTHYISFQGRVFPVNHLHCYWQPNKNNQETEHTNNIKNNTT